MKQVTDSKTMTNAEIHYSHCEKGFIYGALISGIHTCILTKPYDSDEPYHFLMIRGDDGTTIGNGYRYESRFPKKTHLYTELKSALKEYLQMTSHIYQFESKEEFFEWALSDKPLTPTKKEGDDIEEYTFSDFNGVDL